MKLSNRILLESAIHQNAILDTVGVGIISIDEHQVIRFVNQEVESIWGYTQQELVGDTIHLLMPSSYCATHNRAFEKRCQMRATDFATQYREVEGQRKNGEIFPLELRFTSVIIDGLRLFTAAARDITERKRVLEQLQHQHGEITRLSRQLKRERDYLRDEVRHAGAFGEILGQSPALHKALEYIEAVAKTNANVLILGESGVGKELAARALHERSRRSDYAFVKANCAAIPKELFESEFFGHVKGAFTGALKDREGRFELADKGTIFLDEVGETPLELQSKLLRVLEEREFERIGDGTTRRVDIRIIAATNRDLQSAVDEGRFRSDLYYRLGVFPIELPPLRERREDIVPLARLFLRRSAQELNVKEATLPRALEPALRTYEWPGNVRELKNMMERALILSEGRPLNMKTLAIPGVRELMSLDTEDRNGIGTIAEPLDEPSQLDALLQRHRGVIKRVAEELGVSRQTLYRRLEKFGMDPKAYSR